MKPDEQRILLVIDWDDHFLFIIELRAIFVCELDDRCVAIVEEIFFFCHAVHLFLCKNILHLF